MATTYTRPGVYVEEVPPVTMPIAGAGTSTAAFIGLPPKWTGTDIVEVFTNFTEFKEACGDFSVGSPSYLVHAVYGFFNNGGTRCYVARATPPASLSEVVTGAGTAVTQATAAKNAATTAVGQATEAKTEADKTTLTDVVEKAAAAVQQATAAKEKAVAAEAKANEAKQNADAAAAGGDGASAALAALAGSLTSAALAAKEAVVAAAAANQAATTLKDTAAAPELVKTAAGEAASSANDAATAAGEAEASASSAAAVNFVVDLTAALDALEAFDDISIVAAPGITGSVAWSDLTARCEKTQDRVAILDPPANTDWKAVAVDALPTKSDAGAIYYPWIQVFDPGTKANTFVPPSGHIAGLYARVDAQRGVHKAPANEAVRGVLDLQYRVSDGHQEALNPKGVNCIRKLNGAILVWGARTIQPEESDPFKYVNVRRLFNYLRQSIKQGTRWAVFEPNNPDLWAKITRNVSAFLYGVWSTGALFGSKPEEAFYVKCDAETNPPASRALGQVVTEIGVAITKPAEFVIFRLGQMAEDK